MRAKQLDIIVENWKKQYFLAGVPQAHTEEILENVRLLASKDLPPIVDQTHLAALVGIDRKVLQAMVANSAKFYRTFEIPKHSGGKRTITAPYPSLRYIQQWIYTNILQRQKAHGCAHGFVRHRSILTNAKTHAGCEKLLKMDIHDFFGSIPQRYVHTYFHKELGYTTTVSHILTSLCCLNGVLPQGAPTSPALSNLINRSLDRRLYRLAKHFGLKYSRYADDLAFSGVEIPTTFTKYVTSITHDLGLTINSKKTRLYGPGGSKIIAGVSLATGEPRVPRDYRRRLRQELHYIRKYGIEEHLEHNKIKQYNYVQSLSGRVAYWLSIEPENSEALQMKDLLCKL